MFTPLLDPAITGCVTGVHLSTNVAKMYHKEGIYITDIKAFFKSVKLDKLQQAADRMMYKWVLASTRSVIANTKSGKEATPGAFAFRDTTNRRRNIMVGMIEYPMLGYEKSKDQMFSRLRAAAKQGPGEHKTKNCSDYYKNSRIGYTLAGTQLKPDSNYIPKTLRHSQVDIDKLLNDHPEEAKLAIEYLYLIITGALFKMDTTRREDLEHELLHNNNGSIERKTLIDVLNGQWSQTKVSNKKYCIATRSEYDREAFITNLFDENIDSPKKMYEVLRRVMFVLIDSSTTHTGSLPEGAATSPMLANLLLDSIAADLRKDISHPPDHMIMYMDDLSLGYDTKVSDTMRDQINQDLDSIFQVYGLCRHNKKTQVFNTRQRRRILGVNITRYAGNKPGVSIRVTRKYRREVRAMVFNFKKFIKAYTDFLKTHSGVTPDENYVAKHYPKGYTGRAHFDIKKHLKAINGKLSWMQSVSRMQAEPFVQEINLIKSKHLRNIGCEVYQRSMGLIDLKLVRS